jgi:hypothetical protein
VVVAAVAVAAVWRIGLTPPVPPAPTPVPTFAAPAQGESVRVASVAARLEALAASPSRFKDLALRAGALNLGAFFGAQPDTTPKLAGFAYAFENLELGGYELLRRVAERAGDEQTVAMAREIAAEEREAAAKVAATWEQTIRAAMPA